MRESFLHFLWRTKRFDAHHLRTTEFQPIEIQAAGEHNQHAGPDFFNARIQIGDTIWAGNVEMHIRSSEWLAHGHSDDPAYDNVVLHVVFEEDQPILHRNQQRIPCLELKDRIPSSLMEQYERLEREQAWIPCEKFILGVPEIIRLNWYDRLLVERLELKTALIAETLLATNNNWEEAFYRLIARSFGLKVNTEPFENLARSIPLRILSKHKSSLLQLEALLFGQAGFLETEFREDWPRELSREYRHLAHKYSLRANPVSQWKFLRLRPAGFPSIRIAQFAALIFHQEHLFSKVLEINSLSEVEQLFDIRPSDYWQQHFQFGKPSIPLEKPLGKAFIQLLVINTIVPFLFYYGKTKDLEDVQKRAVELLEALPPETNNILTGWRSLGTPAKNAFQSQALIQLKTRYCDQKKCLECAIGSSILK